MANEIIVPKPPIVDLTSIVGIESIFRQGSTDPSGPEIAGYFADLFIWSDKVRYILPIPSDKEPHQPELFKELELRDKKVLTPEHYYVSEAPKISNEVVKESFVNFTIWIENNKMWFLPWIDLHYEPWIRTVHKNWIGRDYFYDMEALKRLPIFEQAVLKLNIETYKLLYAFDILLRYPDYGKRAGNGIFYLAHPIRTEPHLKGVRKRQVPSPPIPFSFKKVVEHCVNQMTQETYTILLHEARNFVKEDKLDTLKPIEVTPDILRKVAVKLSMAPRLKNIPIPEPIKELVKPFIPEKVRCLMSIVKGFWEHPLPSSASKLTWLHPLFKWDLENQAKKREAPYSRSPSRTKRLYSLINLLNIPALQLNKFSRQSPLVYKL